LAKKIEEEETLQLVDFGTESVLVHEGESTSFSMVEELHKTQTVQRSNRMWKFNIHFLQGREKEGCKVSLNLQENVTHVWRMTKTDYDSIHCDQVQQQQIPKSLQRIHEVNTHQEK
jgi:hypothetical protein